MIKSQSSVSVIEFNSLAYLDFVVPRSFGQLEYLKTLVYGSSRIEKSLSWCSVFMPLMGVDADLHILM